MTTEEALNECKNIREDIESEIYLEYYNNTEELQKYRLDIVDTIIEALGKQIPKKPIRLCKIDGYWNCPECHIQYIDDDKQSFCEHCGQAIDWSEDD